ncbi:MAG: hypothetical protein ACRD0H_10060, partial [Actinomycetes bacterium]
HPELAGHAPVRDRAMFRQALSLAGLDGDRAAVQAIPGGPQIAIAWHLRRLAVTRYADCLAGDATHLTPTSVLVSLLHLHHVRAHGIDPASEGLSHRLARAVALAWSARREHTEEPPR